MPYGPLTQGPCREPEARSVGTDTQYKHINICRTFTFHNTKQAQMCTIDAIECYNAIKAYLL